MSTVNPIAPGETTSLNGGGGGGQAEPLMEQARADAEVAAATAADVTKATNFQATVAVVKICVGAGSLALPYAFGQGGILTGTIGLGLIALWNYYTTCLLLRCKEVLLRTVRREAAAAQYGTAGEQAEARQRAADAAKRGGRKPKSTFAALAHRALGPLGVWVVDYCLIFTLMGVCATYQIQIGQLLTSTGWIGDGGAGVQRFVILASAAVVLPLALLRDMSCLAWTSGVALLALAVGFTAIFVYGAQNNAIPDPIPAALLAPPNFQRFSVMFGIIVFAFGIPTIILPIQEGMRRPQEVRTPLRRGMGVVLVLYLLLGVLGLLFFFDDKTLPLQQIIILNLPQTSGVARAVKLLNAVVAVFSYPLPFLPIAQMLEPTAPDYRALALREEEQRRGGAGGGAHHALDGPLVAAAQASWRMRCMAVRTAMVVATTIVAMFVPCFGLVCAFIGCFTVSLLSFILPPIFHLRICRAEALSRRQVATDYFSICFGIGVCLFTSVLTAIQLVDTLKATV